MSMGVTHNTEEDSVTSSLSNPASDQDANSGTGSLFAYEDENTEDTDPDEDYNDTTINELIFRHPKKMDYIKKLHAAGHPAKHIDIH
eukprot:11022149-Ditylum_brightwellii.AAC.1